MLGTSNRGNCDGSKGSAKFIQPSGICTELSSVFEIDSASAQLKLINGTNPLKVLLGIFQFEIDCVQIGEGTLLFVEDIYTQAMLLALYCGDFTTPIEDNLIEQERDKELRDQEKCRTSKRIRKPVQNYDFFY